MDPKVNGQFQKEWGWLIAIYLFLGGVGSGAYVIGAINSFAGESLGLSTMAGLWIAFPALLVGSGCLLLDLGSPLRAAMAGVRVRSSWMARGFWIISLFMVVSFVHLVLLEYTAVGETPGGQKVLAAITVAGIVLGLLTMAYTGVLLSASKGMSFWRSGVVPVVFVVSALVTGHFAIMIGMVLFDQGVATLNQLRVMALEAAGLVVLEVLAIVFFLQAAFRLPDPREAAERILARRAFVYGYFIFGLTLPLVLMLTLYASIHDLGEGGAPGVAFVGAVLGLGGGLILRQAVLSCGALPTLNIGGLQFRRAWRPKEPKPSIGLLPPQ